MYQNYNLHSLRAQELCESRLGRLGRGLPVPTSPYGLCERKAILNVKPVLNWANVCSPNVLRTVRRTVIRFLIELLVLRPWFGQFEDLYFVLNWLVMRGKLQPELSAEAQQTA